VDLTSSEEKQVTALYQEWAELKAPFRTELSPGADRTAEVFRQDILEIAKNVDIRAPIKVTSHRKVLGPVIILVKRLMMRVAAPLINTCLRRQLIINDHVLNMAHRMASLENRIKRLEERLGKL